MSLLRIDVFHPPRIHRKQHGIPALGAHPDSQAVIAIGVDAHGQVAPVVDEDLKDAGVHEYPQFQDFLNAEIKVGAFGWACQHIRVQGGAAGIDEDDIVPSRVRFRSLYGTAIAEIADTGRFLADG